MRYVRLHDHNILGARGIAVRVGRFQGTVTLEIRGTVGIMTVNGKELVDAVTTTMSRGRDGTTLAARELFQVPSKRSTGTHSSRPLVARSASDHARVLSTTANKSAARIASKAKMTTTALGSHDCSFKRRELPRWTDREDRVVRVLSPTMAAEKLHRPLDEIHARRKSLGVGKRQA
jgi:hypothetical protein